MPTEQERLADVLREATGLSDPTWATVSDVSGADSLAKIILDSDVIREIKAEAWDRCADEVAVMNAKSATERANPYRWDQEVSGA